MPTSSTHSKRSFSNSSRQRFALLSRCLTSLLIASMALGNPLPLFAIEDAQPLDSFNFSDVTASSQALQSAGAKSNALNVRKAPISPSGAFSHSVSIQVPPGRNGMTPSLGLSYDSDRATRQSPVGAGWSFGVPRISRWTGDGFPELVRDESSLELHYADSVFSAPDGKIVRGANTDGPSSVDANGNALYLPEREFTPVRYEYDSSGAGSWVEHLPSGVKRYYGETAECGGSLTRRARIRNELGTHSWLLVKEVDADGNCIEYDYHHLDDANYGQDRSDLLLPQVLPVLSEVEWGANESATSAEHLFRVRTAVSDQPNGYIDMMNGHVVLSSRIDDITVEKATSNQEFWNYALEYRTSGDTGNLLLDEVRRVAIGENSTSTNFEYSENVDGVQFSPEKELPPAIPHLDGAYSEMSKQLLSNPDIQRWSTRGPVNNGPSYFVTNPRNLRGATKFQDFNGDGLLDSVYFPSGLGTPASNILFDRTFLRDLTESSDEWSAPPHGWAMDSEKLPNPHSGINLGVPYSSIGDLDGDLDLDAVGYAIDITAQSEAGWGNPIAGGAGDVDSICGNEDIWSGFRCGAIDPPEHCFIDGQSCVSPKVFEDPLKPDVYFDTDGATWLTKNYPATVAQWDMTYDWGEFDEVKSSIYDLHSDVVSSFAPEGVEKEPLYYTMLGSSAVAGDWLGDPMLCLELAKQCYGRESEGVVIHENMSKWRDYLKKKGEEPPPRQCVDPKAKLIVSTNTYQHEDDKIAKEHELMFWPSRVRKRLGWTKDDRTEQFGWDPYYVRHYLKTYTDFEAPLVDVNGDGKSDLVLTKYHDKEMTPFVRGTEFVPRVYLFDGEAFSVDWQVRENIVDAPTTSSDFTHSLCVNLKDDRCTPCATDIEERPNLYRDSNWSTNFNSLYVDLNADGLPDLAAAAPPQPVAGIPGESGFTRECIAGHRTFLNRGYRWGHDGSRDEFGYPIDQSVPSSMASWEGVEAYGVGLYEHPMTWMRNRAERCIDGTVLDDKGDDWGKSVPMSAVAQTDINADGRVDIVFWFTRYGAPKPTRKIFLNTGRGFVDAANSGLNVRSSSLNLTGQSESRPIFGLSLIDLPQNHTSELTEYPDLTRFVDIDNDGLQDIVRAGECNTIEDGQVTDLTNMGSGCRPPKKSSPSPNMT